MGKFIFMKDYYDDGLMANYIDFWNTYMPQNLVMLKNLKIDDINVKGITLNIEEGKYEEPKFDLDDESLLHITIKNEFNLTNDNIDNIDIIDNIDNIYDFFCILPSLISDYLYTNGNLPSYCNYVLFTLLKDISNAMKSMIKEDSEYLFNDSSELTRERRLEVQFSENNILLKFMEGTIDFKESDYFTSESLKEVEENNGTLLFPISERIATEEEIQYMIFRNLKIIGRDSYVW